MLRFLLIWDPAVISGQETFLCLPELPDPTYPADLLAGFLILSTDCLWFVVSSRCSGKLRSLLFCLPKFPPRILPELELLRRSLSSLTADLGLLSHSLRFPFLGVPKFLLLSSPAAKIFPHWQPYDEQRYSLSADLWPVKFRR